MKFEVEMTMKLDWIIYVIGLIGLIMIVSAVGPSVLAIGLFIFGLAILVCVTETMKYILEAHK